MQKAYTKNILLLTETLPKKKKKKKGVRVKKCTARELLL